MNGQKHLVPGQEVLWLRHWKAEVRAVLETEVDEANTTPNLLDDVLLTEFALVDRAYVRYAPWTAENAKAWREQVPHRNALDQAADNVSIPRKKQSMTIGCK